MIECYQQVATVPLRWQHEWFNAKVEQDAAEIRRNAPEFPKYNGENEKESFGYSAAATIYTVITNTTVSTTTKEVKRLYVALSVSRMRQKVLKEFSWNFWKQV